MRTYRQRINEDRDRISRRLKFKDAGLIIFDLEDQHMEIEEEEYFIVPDFWNVENVLKSIQAKTNLFKNKSEEDIHVDYNRQLDSWHVILDGYMTLAGQEPSARQLAAYEAGDIDLHRVRFVGQIVFQDDRPMTARSLRSFGFDNVHEEEYHAQW